MRISRANLAKFVALIMFFFSFNFWGSLPYFKEKVLPPRRAMDARADFGGKTVKNIEKKFFLKYSYTSFANPKIYDAYQ
jgi:hypothetical protein